MGRISLAEADFGARSFLLAIRNLAKTLRTVPGRKTLILFSSGFPLTADRQSDSMPRSMLLIEPMWRSTRWMREVWWRPHSSGPGTFLLDSPFPHEPGLLASLADLPDPGRSMGLGAVAGSGGAGGGGGGGGGRGGGGPGRRQVVPAGQVAARGGKGGTGGSGGSGTGGKGGTGGTGGGGKGGGRNGRRNHRDSAIAAALGVITRINPPALIM